jgi:hypothetical protein
VVIVYPAVALRGHHATITVTGIDVASLQVRLDGATQHLGHPLPWTSLRRTRRGWRAVLPAPEFRGVYPIELRSRPARPLPRSPTWVLRVFAAGTLSRPLFETPEEVARAWVAALPGARLVAIKRWPRSAFDHRNRHLHQRLVVAYEPVGRHALSDRLGIFITAVRDRTASKWRLLEATVVP